MSLLGLFLDITQVTSSPILVAEGFKVLGEEDIILPTGGEADVGERKENLYHSIKS
jgi:hypothetical protein